MTFVPERGNEALILKDFSEKGVARTGLNRLKRKYPGNWAKIAP